MSKKRTKQKKQVRNVTRRPFLREDTHTSFEKWGGGRFHSPFYWPNHGNFERDSCFCAQRSFWLILARFCGASWVTTHKSPDFIIDVSIPFSRPCPVPSALTITGEAVLIFNSAYDCCISKVSSRNQLGQTTLQGPYVIYAYLCNRTAVEISYLLRIFVDIN